MGDTSFNKLTNVESMPSISRQLFLYTTLLFTLTSQAAQDDKHKVNEDLTSPAVPRKFTDSESRQFEIDKRENQDGRFNELEDNQRSNRYGIGYEMRQGGRNGTQGNRGRGR